MRIERRATPARGLKLTLPLLVLSGLLQLLLPISAEAAPSGSLTAVQRQVDQLRTEAADSAEAANGAKVRLAGLQNSLAGIKREQAKQGVAIGKMQRSLGLIAANAYKSGGLGTSIQLLFAQNPSQYLASASQLEVITRAQGIQLRRYTAAEQRFHQTSLIASDRVRQVQIVQRELAAAAALAQDKLVAAEKLLISLKGADRKRFLAAQTARNATEQKGSRVSAKLANTVSGRSGIALRFALSQIGKPYYFGAAGLKSWDCSGLTMVAYARAGVSLPHSSQQQIRYGRRISFAELQPGDLVFFYRNVTHVGIYLGRGLIVDATRPGRNVQVDPISSMPFAGAIRL
jgi:cell wall-associated NlpC family hydrolase